MLKWKYFNVIFPYLKLEMLQCSIKPFDIQNYAIKYTITFSALHFKQELSFTMR